MPGTPFGLTFRTYLPGEAVRTGKWTAPPVVPVGAAGTTLDRRIDEAFEATFPLYEMAKARFNAMVNPLNPAPSPVNGVPVHRRTLIDDTARDVTTPNNDTLYSATWLDLHATPVRIHVPRVAGGRYWSVALLDIFTNNFAVLGRTRDGEGPVDVTIVGPGWTGAMPPGRVIVSPSNDVQVIGRFLVNGPADAPAVHAIQDGVIVTPVDAAAKVLPQWIQVRGSTDPENYLAVVNEMLWRNPVPPAEASVFASWADLGIGGGAYAFARTGADVQAAWRRRLPVLHEGLKEGLKRGARLVSGWSVPSPEVGEFGTNYGLRAAVAFGGLSALPSREAIYLNLENDPATGAPLDGRRHWTLIVPPIAASGFWSLSMYEKDAEGRLFFTQNAIGRYSIGDRTAGITRRPDGSIEILLQHDRPAAHRQLVANAERPMALTLRVYGPSDAMRRGEAPLPRLGTRGCSPSIGGQMSIRCRLRWGSLLSAAIPLLVLLDAAQAVSQTAPASACACADSTGGFIQGTLLWRGGHAPDLSSIATLAAPILWSRPTSRCSSLVTGHFPTASHAIGPRRTAPYVQVRAVVLRGGERVQTPAEDDGRFFEKAQALTIRYFFYYRRDIGVGGHPHDMEAVDLDLRLDMSGGCYTIRIASAVGLAHGVAWYENELHLELDTRLPLTVLVEEGKHASSPDRNADRHLHARLRRQPAGERVLGHPVTAEGSGYLLSSRSSATMTKFRRPDMGRFHRHRQMRASSRRRPRSHPNAGCTTATSCAAPMPSPPAPQPRATAWRG